VLIPLQIHLYLTNHLSPYRQIAHPVPSDYIDDNAARNRGVGRRSRCPAPSSPHTCYSPLPVHEPAIPLPRNCIPDPSYVYGRRRRGKSRCRSSSSLSGTIISHTCYSPFQLMNQPSPSCQIASPIPPLCIDNDAVRNRGVDRHRRHRGPAPSSPHHPPAISLPPVAMPGPGIVPTFANTHPVDTKPAPSPF
jgi:hypothetical protein